MRTDGRGAVKHSAHLGGKDLTQVSAHANIARWNNRINSFSDCTGAVVFRCLAQNVLSCDGCCSGLLAC